MSTELGAQLPKLVDRGLHLAAAQHLSAF